MLCDICQEREATNHTTHMVGDSLTHSNLCNKCFEASKPTEARDLATALQAGCRYCDGEPHGGGYDPVALLSGIRTLNFMCKPCTEEYYRFLRQKCPGFGETRITNEQTANICTSDFSTILIEAEEYMKRWVAEERMR
jgi:protein-arginine kinase activator protein McsA